MVRRLAPLAVALCLALSARGAYPAEVQIDADVPAGNIVVERVEGDRVDLRQDLRDTEGWWFYWHFRVRGAAGRTLTFRFTNGNPIGVRGPAASGDAGKSWRWLGAKSVQGPSFTHAFGPNDDDVRFCFAMPYVAANLDEFLKRHAGSRRLRAETLCKTKNGRSVELLRLGKLDGPPKRRVFIACRHHACEMMASWALEGLIESVLADADHGRWLRENVQFLIVPFVDKDGVEAGDQGKNRKPHDHNRDYLGPSIYPSVAAIRQLVPKWSQGRLDLALDLHCPWIRGGGDGPGSNEQIVLVGGPGAETWARQQAFGKALQEVQRGPLVYHPKHNIPHGVGWNTGDQPRSCARWAAMLPGTHTAVTVELPYATAGGKPVTIESARAFGHDLARAIRKHLGEP